ncbi:MAG: hypothetical protein R3B99_20460 [Polyangiales bacterium]
MVELNVEARLVPAPLDCMKRAWDSGRQLHIHGWVYGLSGGHVRDLLTLTAENQTVVAAAEVISRAGVEDLADEPVIAAGVAIEGDKAAGTAPKFASRP